MDSSTPLASTSASPISNPQTKKPTATSFSSAVKEGAKLSSHGPQFAPSLERGSACRLCKTRKIRCDGVRPVCGSCMKSATAKGEEPEHVMHCDFSIKERKKPDTSAAAKVVTLEARIADLERELAASRSQSPNSFSPPRPTSTSATLADFDLTQQPHQPLSSVPLPYDSPPTAPESDSLFALFWPGWDPSLPSPLLVNRLLSVYFEKIHTASGMINQGRFQALMLLPPTSQDFPTTCLLHGMLSCATKMVSADFFADEPNYWGEGSIADYHAEKCEQLVGETFLKRGKGLQAVQAAILVCFHWYLAAKFAEVFLLVSRVSRMCLPLGINHLRAAERHGSMLIDKPVHMKRTLLEPTDDPETLQERASTFWCAVLCDRIASASTGWSLSLPDSEITTLLPAPMAWYPATDLHLNPLSIHSPSFLITHPPHLVGTRQLHFKALILMGHCLQYICTAPFPVGMGVHVLPPGQDLRKTATFLKLERNIEQFQSSIPREFQDLQAHANRDSNVCLIFSIPHVSLILLHEPIVSEREDDPSMAKCSTSAKAIRDSALTLYSTSFELGLLSPFILYCWAVAGRTLVRELALKQARGVQKGCQELASDVKTLLSAIRSARTPLGAATAQTLQALLNKPEQCLPHPSPLFSGAYVSHQRSYPAQPHPGNPSFFNNQDQDESGGTGIGNYAYLPATETFNKLKRKAGSTELDTSGKESLPKGGGPYFTTVNDMSRLFEVDNPTVPGLGGGGVQQLQSVNGATAGGGLSPEVMAALGPEYARYLDQAQFVATPGVTAPEGGGGAQVGAEVGGGWESLLGGDRAALGNMWEAV